jgi:hypothetical protein
MIDADVDCLYINGDSWAYGSELRDPSRPDIANDFDPVHDSYRQRHNWAGLLGQELGLPVINHGWAGGSNHRILRTTIDDITRLVRTGRRPFVILAWTQIQRFELWDNEKNHWMEYVSPASEGNKDIGLEIWSRHANDISDLTQYLQHLILADAFLKTNNVPYFGTNVFRHNFNILEDLARDPQFASHLWQLSNTIRLDRHMYNVSISQLLAPHREVQYGAGGHPLERGQEIIAENLAKQLLQQYKFKTTGTQDTA